MSKRIGIFCLGHRRPRGFITHAKQLAKCGYSDFHFHLFGDGYTKEYAEELMDVLKDRITLHTFPNGMNYMMKIRAAVSMDYEYSIKYDEDCFMTSESWDRLFSLSEKMKKTDLCGTGVMSIGIPTVELFLENHAQKIKDELYADFCNTDLGVHGVDYTSLNEKHDSWNSRYFYSKVKNFNHHYKGIHPIRVNLQSVKKINDYVVENFYDVMKPKDCPIISDNSVYPYFCNSVFIIKTDIWKSIIFDKSLYVDDFDEVPLNKYRDKFEKNLVIDTGIPIIHTMYNWNSDWAYENSLIEKICLVMDNL